MRKRIKNLCLFFIIIIIHSIVISSEYNINNFNNKNKKIIVLLSDNNSGYLELIAYEFNNGLFVKKEVIEKIKEKSGFDFYFSKVLFNRYIVSDSGDIYDFKFNKFICKDAGELKNINTKNRKLLFLNNIEKKYYEFNLNNGIYKLLTSDNKYFANKYIKVLEFKNNGKIGIGIIHNKEENCNEVTAFYNSQDKEVIDKIYNLQLMSINSDHAGNSRKIFFIDNNTFIYVKYKWNTENYKIYWNEEQKENFNKTYQDIKTDIIVYSYNIRNKKKKELLYLKDKEPADYEYKINKYNDNNIVFISGIKDENYIINLKNKEIKKIKNPDYFDFNNGFTAVYDVEKDFEFIIRYKNQQIGKNYDIIEYITIDGYMFYLGGIKGDIFNHNLNYWNNISKTWQNIETVSSSAEFVGVIF